ncbi:MAG: FAD-dependent oxidoreductase [Burkholderiaceae bacterium]|nr:FAD-dependent oxidoreductase [Burkholderiaceae bacterium]
MRVAIVGAGIAGITTAYELARDGHEVTVLERHDAVAAQASFANAGLIGPALLAWQPQPGAPARGRAQRSTMGELQWRARWHGAEWRWLRQWRRGSAAGGSARTALLHLLLLGEQRQASIARSHGISYERGEGLLALRGQQDAVTERRWQALQALGETGQPLRTLDAPACRALEPGLHPGTALDGGLHLPQAGAGNCREFAHRLRLLCERDGGVRFHFQTEVRALHAGASGPTLRLAPRPTEAAEAGRGNLQAEQRAFLPTLPDPPPPELDVDAVVLASGAVGTPLLESLGVDLPLQPVWGLGVTFRLREELLEQAPRAALVELDSGITFSRLGQRLRICGGWLLGGSADSAAAQDYNPLYAALDRWFPLAVQRDSAQLWRGARPMLPDGLPVIGRSARPGVWLQLGHGALGWGLSCSAARLLADQLAGRPCELDPAAFAASRWTASP